MITVCVCVLGDAEPAPECLATLNGSRPRVVRGQTVWQARQAALAACETDVIAFVDGDVVVGDRWLERLRSAWGSTGSEIAAIGGPITGGARGAVADALDWGTDPLDVDPLERTLIGGNLSFRRRALVGVGGFGATVDGRDARDWLADEHEAQRQLGHWGWLVRYRPELAATRVRGWSGAPRSGRLRYGVRLAIAGARPPWQAFRALVPAAAGTIVASAQRRADLRRLRAARAIENAGVLAAPLLAPKAWRARGADSGEAGAPAALRPDRAHALAPARRTSVWPPFVLLYHRIAPAAGDPLGMCVCPANFSDQVEVLSEIGRVVALDEMAERPTDGSVAVTFDDGYADNIVPLRTAGIPVTLFASTGHVASGRRFFWDDAAQLIIGSGPRPERLLIDVDGRTLDVATRTEAQRRAALATFHRLVQPRSAETIGAALAQLRAWAGANAAEPLPETRVMTPAELSSLAQSGIAIGAHTRNHVNLAHQLPDVVTAEVQGSRSDVTEWTGTPPSGFSYPFGIPRHDVDGNARNAVADAGFSYAVVNQPVPVGPESERLALPRLFAPNLDGARFREWLSRLLD